MGDQLEPNSCETWAKPHSHLEQAGLVGWQSQVTMGDQLEPNSCETWAKPHSHLEQAGLVGWQSQVTMGDQLEPETYKSHSLFTCPTLST